MAELACLLAGSCLIFELFAGSIPMFQFQFWDGSNSKYPYQERTTEMATPQLHIYSDAAKLQSEVCDFVAAAAKKAIESSGHFSVGLSGGSVAKIISQGLRGRSDIDWSKWHVFYCDERVVPFTSEDSTHAFIKRELLDKVALPQENIYAIDPSLDAQGAAEDYIRKIRKLYPGEGYPSFHLLLLGMGPDGHTCSLFPGHAGLQAKEVVIPITDSPKPPPQRITLTVPVLNSAKCLIVISTGASKADAVKGCLEPGAGVTPLPAGVPRPTNGELHWYMDEGAAAKLQNK